jgi:serine/threonine protein kinase
MSAADWDRVQDLFLRASELKADARPGFLDSHCDDGPVRCEVETLLAADEESDQRLRSIVSAAAFGMQQAEAGAAVGLRIGPYVVEREIGSGGMGTVYLAFRDDDQFHQRVAIKVVNRGMDSEFALTRFRRERQVLADLQHSHIARLLDGGATSEGLPFFAMEYLEGVPVTEYCRRRRADLRAILDLFLRICGAVQYAHRSLVIHGDLKPGNILVSEDGTPKLLDFGIATLIGVHSEAPETRSPLTARYASPEQLRGNALSTAADVYSLGAILDELTAGQARGDLDYVIGMATHTEAAERYASVDELARDTSRSLDSRPILARHGSPWYRSAKFIRRRWFPLLAAGAVLSSLVGGIVVSRAREREASAARQVAEDRLTQMVSLSNKSLSDVSLLMERLPGAMPARRELIGATVGFLEKLSKDAGPDTRLRLALAKAYSRLGQLQGGPDSANMGDVEDAIKSYRAGSALLEGAPSGLLASDERLAVWLEMQRKLGTLATGRPNPEAVPPLLNALNLTARLSPSQGANAGIMRSRAGLYLALARAFHDNRPRAIGYAKQNLEALEALEGHNTDADLKYDLSISHNELGYLLWNEGAGDPAAAVAHYQECMRIREQLVREHPLDMVYRSSLMLSYQHFAALQGGALVASMGNTEVARLYYRKALAIAEAGSADAQDSLWASEYAGLLVRYAALDVPAAGLAESLATLRKAAGIFDSLGDSRGLRYNPIMATAHEYMGRRLTAMGRYNEASAEHLRARSLAAAVLAAHPGDGVSAQQIAAADRGIARATAMGRNRPG